MVDGAVKDQSDPSSPYAGGAAMIPSRGRTVVKRDGKPNKRAHKDDNPNSLLAVFSFGSSVFRNIV